MSGPNAPRRPWTAADVAELVLSAAALFSIVEGFAAFAARVETRPGALLRDPVLAALTPHDMTWVIFTVMYVSIGWAFTLLVRDPPALSLGIRAYALMVLFRMVAMSVTPLDAPLGAIPLRDPFIQQLWDGRTLTRDLFFSGHTATLSVVAFSTRHRIARRFFAAATVAVGACLVWQAVHYTIDVLAAPVFAYAAFRVASGASRRTPALRQAPFARPAPRGVPGEPPLDRKVS